MTNLDGTHIVFTNFGLGHYMMGFPEWSEVCIKYTIVDKLLKDIYLRSIHGIKSGFTSTTSPLHILEGWSKIKSPTNFKHLHDRIK